VPCKQPIQARLNRVNARTQYEVKRLSSQRVDWNEQFQTLLDLPEDTAEDKLKKYSSLSHVAKGEHKLLYSDSKALLNQQRISTLPSLHFTSPHLTPHLTSPHLTSPHLTSPHLTHSLTCFTRCIMTIGYVNLLLCLFGNSDIGKRESVVSWAIAECFPPFADFTYAAELCARVIINELSVPVPLKTIKVRQEPGFSWECSLVQWCGVESSGAE
jgi:hypothetical protein